MEYIIHSDYNVVFLKDNRPACLIETRDGEVYAWLIGPDFNVKMRRVAPGFYMWETDDDFGIDENKTLEDYYNQYVAHSFISDTKRSR